MRRLYVGAIEGLGSDAEREALSVLKLRLSDVFRAPVSEMDLPRIDFAYDAGRRQYASIAVLGLLDRLCPPDALKLLAVTSCDLFIPVLTFVYGQAQLGGRVGVVSLARLKQEFYGLEPDREALLERAAKEALHEAGHLFGLAHCADRECAMALSTDIRQIDRKRAELCGGCAGWLERHRKEQYEDALADPGGG